MGGCQKCGPKYHKHKESRNVGRCASASDGATGFRLSLRVRLLKQEEAQSAGQTHQDPSRV